MFWERLKMIEEKEDLEQEIYDLCENVNIINEKNAGNITKIVENDKINFITRKIKKISRYIKNIELPLELQDDKKKLIDKLNAILKVQNNISELLEGNPININSINSNIDSMITIIKELESLTSVMVDVSVFTQKTGIKDNVILYRRELNKLVEEIDKIKENNSKELKVLRESDISKINEINQKFSEIQENMENQLVTFNGKIDKFKDDINQKNLELTNIKSNYETETKAIEEDFRKKFSELEKEANEDFEILKENINKKDEKISELIGLIGNKANIGEYKSNADKAHQERIRWQIATVVIFVIAFILMVIITISTKDYNITTLARYIVSVILLGMSGYTGKQASNQRKDEVYYRKQQLELSSIDVYLDDMPEDTKVEIKQKLAERIFGQASETYKSKYDDTTSETLDKLIKLIENIAKK